MVNMLAGQATTPFPTGGIDTFTNTGSTASTTTCGSVPNIM